MQQISFMYYFIWSPTGNTNWLTIGHPSWVDEDRSSKPCVSSISLVSSRLVSSRLILLVISVTEISPYTEWILLTAEPTVPRRSSNLWIHFQTTIRRQDLNLLRPLSDLVNSLAAFFPPIPFCPEKQRQSSIFYLRKHLGWSVRNRKRAVLWHVRRDEYKCIVMYSTVGILELIKTCWLTDKFIQLSRNSSWSFLNNLVPLCWIFLWELLSGVFIG
jgi:hypothetical protein